MLREIISGGQTGADRAALDAALAVRFPCGGFCPAGRQAEDGRIDDRYPLAEVEGGYRHRTWQNAEASEGTAIFYDTEPSGGTELTLSLCIKLKKPYKLLDISMASHAAAVQGLADFIERHEIETLNVAGPRASSSPAMYGYVFAVISALLEQNGG